MSRSLIALAVLLTACSNGDPLGIQDPGSPLPPPGQSAPDPTQAARARAIAAEYQSYGRVDDELRWAPFLCRIPLPGVGHISASNHLETHGQKLYSVFAKDHAGYPSDSKVGQVIVKQAFLPEALPPGTTYQPGQVQGGNVNADHFYPYAEKDGVVYRAGAFAGLYILYKVDASDPKSDHGWVYATITPDGQVTAAGRIASCMGCHEEAPHDRLFGVARAYP